jgi:NADH:ubiquinone oxidoreductase subunit B-like Fe-S oxidoreductase
VTEQTKKWWRSKTLWFNVLVAAGAAVEMSLSVIQGHFDPRVYLAIVGAVSGVNVILRFISTQGLTK